MIRMDVVFTLGNGSEHFDWELRMSLRSCERFFPALGRVWIVGHCLGWVDPSSVRFISFLDSYTHNKDANLIAKLVRASMEPSLTQEFIFCSDDQSLLQPCMLEDFRPYHRGNLATKAEWETDKWRRRLHVTMRALHGRGLPVFDFEGHIPYRVTKPGCRRFLEYPFGEGNGFTVMTLYHDTNRIGGIPLAGSGVRARVCSAEMSAAAIEQETCGKRLLPAPSRFENPGGWPAS